MKQLRRSVLGKRIAGVCAGIADYLDIDPVVVRLLWVLTILWGGSGILAYIICWIGIPAQNAGHSSNNIYNGAENL